MPGSVRPAQWPDLAVLGPAPADEVHLLRIDVRPATAGARGAARPRAVLEISCLSRTSCGELRQDVRAPLSGAQAVTMLRALLPALTTAELDLAQAWLREELRGR